MLLYIDPGTGSMLFTVLIGLLSAGVYFFRDLSLKLKFGSLGTKKKAAHGDKLPIVIFSDHKRYWNIFEPLCDEFEKRKQKVVYMTASEDDPALEKKYEYIEGQFIGTGNKAFTKLIMLNAKIVLSTTPSLDVFQWKRSRDVDYYIHILHTPVNFMYRMFGIDYYDAMLLGGKFQGEQVRDLEKLRHLPEKEIEYIGIPYMDEMKKRLDAMNTGAEERTDGPKVLLAPTWGESGLLRKYGTDLIDGLIATGYDLTIRPHPQSYTADKDLIDELKEKYPESEKLHWNRDNDNFDILNRSDILISDFSGVIFDFMLVFDKPVIYTAARFDKSPYDCWWLDKELWTFEVLPKIGRELSYEDASSLKALIDECLQDKKYADGRKEARAEAWPYMGEGAVRAVDFIEKKYNELTEAEEAV